MSTSNRVGRAAESAAVNLVPLLLVAAVLYVLWRIFESKAGETLAEIRGAAGEFAGSQQAAELEAQAVSPGLENTGLTAGVDQPPEGGRAARGLFGSTYPFKFHVNNPGAVRNARAKVTVTEYSHWPYDNKVSVWSEVVTLKAGMNSFTVTMPITAGGFKLDAVSIVEIDGTQYASNQYVIE